MLTVTAVQMLLLHKKKSNFVPLTQAVSLFSSAPHFAYLEKNEYGDILLHFAQLCNWNKLQLSYKKGIEPNTFFCAKFCTLCKGL